MKQNYNVCADSLSEFIDRESIYVDYKYNINGVLILLA